MDFSCDRCGRRYFVPDELVQGRTFRAKCDACNHAFVVDVPVVVPDAFGVPEPGSAGEPLPAGQALSDSELAEISKEVGPLLPQWPELAEAPAPGPTSWPQPAGEPNPGLRARPGPAGRAPSSASARVPWPESIAAAPPKPPAAPGRSPDSALRSSIAAPRPEISAPVSGAQVARRAPASSTGPTPLEGPGTSAGEHSVPPASPSVDTRRQDARMKSPRGEAPTEAKPEASARTFARREQARRSERERDTDASALTEEDIIAAGTRHRHRRGIVVVAAVLGACALGALLFSRTDHPDAQASRRRGPSQPSGAATASTTVPLDASSLAARGKRASPPPASAKAGSARKRRRAVRLDDRKLYDLLARKEDVAMAAPSDDVELDSAKDALDPAAVERTVAARRRAFDACVTKALRLNPGLRVSKRATLIVTVQPNGKVTGGWIAEEQIEGTDLGRCLVTASSRMSFPTFEGEAIDVSIPLSLSAIQ